jgi:hypothetical protein
VQFFELAAKATAPEKKQGGFMKKARRPNRAAKLGDL